MNTMSDNYYAEFITRERRRELAGLDGVATTGEPDHPVRYGIGKALIRLGQWLGPPPLEPLRTAGGHPPC